MSVLWCDLAAVQVFNNCYPAPATDKNWVLSSARCQCLQFPLPVNSARFRHSPKFQSDRKIWSQFSPKWLKLYFMFGSRSIVSSPRPSSTAPLHLAEVWPADWWLARTPDLMKTQWSEMAVFIRQCYNIYLSNGGNSRFSIENGI